MAVNWRKIFTSPYSDKTHFIYELIQNADDSKSTRLEFHLCENELIVWNDGRQFTEKDKESICSIGFSNKDLTQIGTFGMGITAVFTYTDCLEVYSGDKYFRIQIKDPTKPENIDFDAIDSTITEQLGKGRTVFRLPFRERLREKDITKLRDRLCNLGEKRPLLFLRHLERVAWRDELSAQVGSYFCHRCRRDKMQNASEVELTTSLDDNNQRSETFLIFRKEAQPPQNVVAELLLQAAEDEDEYQRIQRSAEKLQPVEIAFRLQDDKITTMTERCMLFSYLSTQKETHLRFIIQARYQTTLARDNIEEMENNLWNEWLVTETANSLPEVLEQLKEAGLLKPAFFDVLPLKGEVEKAFKPIAKALRQAMRERAFIPTKKEGHYAKIENVLYPHDKLLPEFIESSWLRPNSSWLHPDIQDKEEFRRRFTFMHDAGVNIIDFRRMFRWLEEQDSDWFEDKSSEWLCSLYAYLNKHQSELERIKKLPLVRLENGRHVCASEAFFPPETDEEYEEIAPFLNELPILQSALLEGEDCNDVKDFLDDLGVEMPHPENLINRSIFPLYRKSDKPSVMENRLHVRYIFKVWDKLSGYQYRNLRKEISETPILWTYNGCQPETFDFVKPRDAYLPKSYTGNTDLETYFSVSDGDVWFVDDIYLEGDPDTKTWLKFLKAIGSEETLRVIKKSVPVNDEECSSRGIRRWRTASTGKEVIEDRYLCGLSVVLDKIRKHKRVDLSRALWYLLVKILPSAERDQRDTFFQGIYSSRYRSNSSPTPQPFLADFYRQLKETAWLPDEQGKLRTPSECFAPTTENRRVLGGSVIYLHPNFDISQDNEAARWLADKLDINLNADINSVLKYLETLSSDTEVSIEKVEPLYRFLAQRDARRSEEFKQKPLIFTSSPEPRWWRSDQVFWEDKHEVFGNHRGYLQKNYAGDEGTLERFFTALGVLRNPSLSNYAQVIREVTSREQADDPKVRARVETLYRYIMPYLKEADNSLENEGEKKEWDRIREGRCWLAKKGDEWGFFFWHELVWKDDDYRYRLFKDKVRFWAFDDDLVELAKKLGVKGCYEISDVKFNYYSEQGENQIWSEEVRNLHPYIHDFLHSPNLRKGHEVKKSAEILDQISVCQAERLKVEYKLNGFPVPDPNPRQSFLDEKNQTLWLGLAESEGAYPDLIGDALQDHFRIDQLREFVKDLLPSTNLSETALLRWERRGFQPNLCLLHPESDSNEDEKNSPEAVDVKFPSETGGEDDSRTDDSEVETPMVHEKPKTGNEENDSEMNDSETPTHQPRPGGSETRPRGRNRSGKSNGNRGAGHSSGRSGGTEDNTHMGETNTSPHARKEIERIGMEHARHYEEKQGCTVEDVSTENLGFDLRSTTPNGEIRYIEVKARAERALVVLTSNEWDTAEQLKDDYFLYVVLNAKTQPERYIIQNPAGKVEVDERYDVRYQVPLSEIEEHGKLV